MISKINISGKIQLGSIAKLKEITTLDLSGSELTELPDLVGSLTNLMSLNLSLNNLSELPDSIGKLTNMFLPNGNGFFNLPKNRLIPNHQINRVVGVGEQ